MPGVLAARFLDGDHESTLTELAADPEVAREAAGLIGELCRTWAGRAPDGTIARIVSDLGLLHVDPAAHPDDPLRPGSPPAEPTYERVLAPPELEAGVASGDRYGADGDTVTVLEVMRAEHSWLRTVSVWFRRDRTRAGDILPAAEFRQRSGRVAKA